jgi:pseudaminic acid synthase
MKEIRIGPHTIGPDHPPFIVAELSGNHNQSLEKAKKLLSFAKGAGVHAVKLQTYTPDTITLNIQGPDFYINEPSSLWKGRTLYDLYKEAHTPWEWHEQLFQYAKDLGLVIFSSPFDETAVDFLEKLDPPCYKVASPEIVDLPLIAKMASTGKPLMISTGGASLEEIEDAVSTAKKAGCRDLVLLKCTMAYPAKPEEINLRTLPHLAKTFETCVGLSDHTLGIGVAIASIPFGVCVIEKHFTDARSEGGVDSAFSMEPDEFRLLVEESKKAWQALGSVHYGPLSSEKVSYSHRPSLYFVEDIEKGTRIEPHHIRSVRPGRGLPPKELEKVIGLTLKENVKKGTPVSWDFFKL